MNKSQSMCSFSCISDLDFKYINPNIVIAKAPIPYNEFLMYRSV